MVPARELVRPGADVLVGPIGQVEERVARRRVLLVRGERLGQDVAGQRVQRGVDVEL